MNLTSSTPYGVESFVDASNGLPVWIDEYRPGARAEAKLRLDQLLRDIFTGQASMKGGISADRLKVREIRTTAPTIVSGEDRFTETSHVDRMVLVRLTKGGQGDLRALDRTATAGWGRAYLEFLTQTDPRDHEPDPPVYATPWLDARFDDRLHSRQALTMAVLRYGWLLLEGFVTDYGRNGYDFELVTGPGSRTLYAIAGVENRCNHGARRIRVLLDPIGGGAKYFFLLNLFIPRKIFFHLILQ
jgi:hypothetical protein